MNERTGFRMTPQLILGVSIALLGALFLLDNLRIIYIGDFWDFWPALLIVFGLSKMVQPRGSSGRVAGLIFTTIGAALLLDNLRLINFNIWNYWPLLLVIAGASLIWRAWDTGRAAQPGNNTEGVISVAAILGGVKRVSTSPNFSRGEFTAIMGGCDVDLRQASMQNSPAVINIFALWGGVDIKVPNDWSVEIQGMPILGGFDDKTFHPQNSAKRLLVKGAAIMGGVEVLN